jgi:cytochrome c553
VCLTIAVAGGARAVEQPGNPGEPPPGATTCSGCHAPAGSNGFVPINGRNASDLASAMEAFRSGERPATLMPRLMKGFSHDEIKAIAAWISAQR